MTHALLAAVIASLATQSPNPTIPDLIASLHKARQVNSYHLLIDAKTVQGNATPYVYQVWKDGTRYRTEFLHDFDGNTSARRIHCTNGPNVGEFFTVAYDRKPDLSKTAALGPLTAAKVVDGLQMLRFEDLGATFEPLISLTARGLAWHVDQKEWTKRDVIRAQWKGLAAYKIVLAAPDHPSNASLEVTLVPDRGFAAVEVRGEWINGQKTVYRSSSGLEQVHGIWLPVTHTCTEHANGNLVKSHVEKIRYVSVNKPLDPKAFTLEGFDLIPGTFISTASGIMKWDGKQIVAVPIVVAPEIKPLPLGANQ